MKIKDIEFFLQEGIKFGQKEMSDILSRAEDFNVGIEYEFRPTSKQKVYLAHWFKKYGIYNISEITPEHDEMTEIITDKMSVSNAIDHLDKMFSLIENEEIEVPEMAGLHISISTNKYDLNDINMAKFLVLMNAKYLNNIFPERSHTNSIFYELINKLNLNKNIKFNKQFISSLENKIESTLQDKLQSIKISDYTLIEMKGRIELRFFGGENYHKQASLIKREILRSLHLLEIAYTDLYQKEYYKELYDLLFTQDALYIKQVSSHPRSIGDIENPSEDVQLAAVKKDSRAIGKIENPTERVQLLAVEKRPPIIKEIANPTERVKMMAVKKDPRAIVFIYNPSDKVSLVAYRNDKRKSGDVIRRIIEDGVRRPDLERYIANHEGLAIKYAIKILKGPFPEAEDNIAKSSVFSIPYAKRVLNDRFEKGEDTILESYNLKMIKEYMDFMKEKGYNDVANKFKEHYDKVKEELGE